ncbi:DUF6259 domain-containing protein [bacterium]|nr:DUF6259 domain-containing protein [bacterium]
MTRLHITILAGVLMLTQLPQSGWSASVSDEATRVVLRNDRLTMALGKAEKGALVSLVRSQGPDELCAPQATPRLFSLTLSHRGAPNTQLQYLGSETAEGFSCKAADRSATLTFTRLGGQDISAVCTATVSDSDPLVRWRIEVSFPHELMLESLQFPVVTLRAPLHADQEDQAVMAATKGGVWPRPSQWKDGTRVSRGQPGSLTAQFGCYYDAVCGLYLAAEDAEGYPKSYEFRRTTDGLLLTWNHECYASDRYATAYDVVMTTFQASSDEPGLPTDWRDAADLYKAWAVKQEWCAKTFAEREDVPAWMKSGAPMVRFGRNWLASPALIQRWIDTYWRANFPADLDLITAYWGWEKVSTWVTPDYFPVFPSDEQFTALVKATRDEKCHAFLWPSGYHYTRTFGKQADGSFTWDDRERFDRVAAPHAVVGPSGAVLSSPRSWLQGGETATMCPGDPWTIDWFNHTATEICKRGGEIVQVDQVVGGNFPRCFSTAHPHPQGAGPWMTQVFRRQLETMLQECRKIEPDALVCFEEPNEWFIQQVAIQDYRDWEVLRESPAHDPASVFNYLYHEYLPTFQSNPRPDDLVMAAHCLVTGQIPHFVPRQMLGGERGIPNGAFDLWSGESILGWGKVDGYQGQVWKGKCFKDATVKHGGDFSLRLQNDTPDETVQVSQNIAVGDALQIGHTYRISVWMRSGGVGANNGIGLGTFTRDMKGTGGARIPMPAAASDEWQQGQATFSVPEGTGLLRIMLHLAGKGTLWIDDMTLDEVLPDGTVKPVTVRGIPGDHEFMQQWVRLFSGEGRPYLFLGKMIHPPKLECDRLQYEGRSFPVLLHNAFEAADGSRAVVMVNISDKPQTGVLTWRGTTQTLTLKPWEVRLLKG